MQPFRTVKITPRQLGNGKCAHRLQKGSPQNSVIKTNSGLEGSTALPVHVVEQKDLCFSVLFFLVVWSALLAENAWAWSRDFFLNFVLSKKHRSLSNGMLSVGTMVSPMPSPSTFIVSPAFCPEGDFCSNLRCVHSNYRCALALFWWATFHESSRRTRNSKDW